MGVLRSIAVVPVAALLSGACAAGSTAAPAPPPDTSVVASSVAASTGPRPTAAPGTVARSPRKPRIVNHLIPFPASRKRQMAHYSKIHYGRAGWRLRPRVIVEHYTATLSLASVFATFASNAPDAELGQLPGTCAHFVVARNGTIYRLVPTGIRCRHTVGLNHRAIGIEHVGLSDGQVMRDRRQLRASLRLTAWLMAKYGIGVGDVIGHSESVASRYHRELYRPWRCQTHADFNRTTMDRYRQLLVRRLRGSGVDTSPPRWRPSHC